MIEIIPFTNKEDWLKNRAQDITSTDAAALMGLSPYKTVFELWHEKKSGGRGDIEENEFMKWGKRFETPIALGLAEDHGIEGISPLTDYMRDPDLKMGSSFDYAIKQDGLLEIKNVGVNAYQSGWITDGDEIQAPPHIELQIQHQFAVSGREYGYIGAVIGGNKGVLLRRDPDIKIITEIKKRISLFWQSIENDIEPLPDFVKDARFINQLYKQSNAGEAINVSNNPRITELTTHYKTQSDIAKDAWDKRDAAKAEILTLIGAAERAQGDAFSIFAGTIKATIVPSFQKKGYRNFRITFKEPK